MPSFAAAGSVGLSSCASLLGDSYVADKSDIQHSEMGSGERIGSGDGTMGTGTSRGESGSFASATCVLACTQVQQSNDPMNDPHGTSTSQHEQQVAAHDICTQIESHMLNRQSHGEAVVGHD
eukprot:14891681-Alexandrium_andersonii.AAC.1